MGVSGGAAAVEMEWDAGWTAEEEAVLAGFTSPWEVQRFLDGVAYSADPIYRSPASVLRDRKAHCFDGAVLAAAGLRRLGFRPLIIDLQAVRDDDHVVAVYEIEGHWGAVSKSNVSMLRWREPVYRSVRELVMSYFEAYYNLAYEKTLRGFSELIDLSELDELGWAREDAAMEVIAARLDSAPHEALLTPAMIERLAPVDQRLYDAGLLGAVREGLYVPE